MNVIDQLIFNVQTLGQIPKNKRINTTKEFIYIEEDTVLQGVNRWYCGASRDKSVTFIIKEISLLIEVSKLISASSYLVIQDVIFNDIRLVHVNRLKQIRDCLVAATTGLTNLSYTYDDPNVTAKLQFITNEINEHLVALNVSIANADDAMNYIQQM